MTAWLIFALGTMAGACVGCGIMCIFVANSRFRDEPDKKEGDTHEQV